MIVSLAHHTNKGEGVSETPSAGRKAQAEERVYTNDVDALEALILAGLPPDEMQAAAWVLVQRVRGLRDDLNRLQQALINSRGMKERTLSE